MLKEGGKGGGALVGAQIAETIEGGIELVLELLHGRCCFVQRHYTAEFATMVGQPDPQQWRFGGQAMCRNRKIFGGKEAPPEIGNCDLEGRDVAIIP
jgi:hypothetical protein